MNVDRIILRVKDGRESTNLLISSHHIHMHREHFVQTNAYTEFCFCKTLRQLNNDSKDI